MRSKRGVEPLERDDDRFALHERRSRAREMGVRSRELALGGQSAPERDRDVELQDVLRRLRRLDHMLARP